MSPMTMAQALAAEFAQEARSTRSGQLSVYLRLLETPVPPVYGPTADEQ